MARTKLTVNDRSLPFKREVELAWAAGFFDGEGHTRVSKRSTYVTKDGIHRTYNHNVNPVVQMSQTDKCLLDRFYAAVGNRGTISGPFKQKKGGGRWSDFWCYRCNSFDDAVAVMDLLLPYLSPPKEDQWLSVIAKVVEARATWSVTDRAA
jgi:hypothetical protein